MKEVKNKKLEGEGWMPYLTLIDKIYHNDILLYNLKILDENNKIWWWVKDIESFAMGMHDYEISSPYIYLTETYSDVELADLKVKIVPATVEIREDDGELTLTQLMEQIRQMGLQSGDKVYVEDNLHNKWYFDAGTSNLMGIEEEALYCNEECKEEYSKNFTTGYNDRLTTVHNDIELASIRFKIIKCEKEKDKLKDSIIREINTCMYEIQARVGIISELVNKLKECE